MAKLSIRRLRILAAPLFLGAASWVVAQPAPSRPLPREIVEKIEAEVRHEMAAKGIPGMSVAVAVNGSLAWTDGFGFADLENSVPAKASTLYRLASISKSVTAVAALKLVEERKLDLDAPISQYVPAFPPKPWPITCRQLLGHLSGIRHYRPGEIESTKHYRSLLESLDIFKNDPLLFEPGTRYQYTTYGYTLLGAAMEAAAGEPFEALLRRTVVEPAGMHTMRVDSVFDIIPDRAQGYTKSSDGKLRNSGLADTSYKIPGGGLCSTAGDLVRLAAALMEGKLLKPESVEAMWTPLKLRDGTETGYGLGFRLEARNGFKVVYHTGAQQRVNTILLMVPAKKLAVAVMCNLEGAGPTPLARRIAAILSPDLGDKANRVKNTGKGPADARTPLKVKGSGGHHSRPDAL